MAKLLQLLKLKVWLTIVHWQHKKTLNALFATVVTMKMKI